MDEGRSLSAEDVRRVARLARLSVDDAEAERERARLGAVLGYVERLRSLDLEGVSPMAHAGDEVNRLRDDEPGAMLDRAALEAMAPATLEGFVRVPKVLGDGGGA